MRSPTSLGAVALAAAVLTSCVDRRSGRLPPVTPVSGLWEITGLMARPGNTLPDPPEVLGITSIEVVETITRIHPLVAVHDAEALLQTAYAGAGAVTAFVSTATPESARLVWTWEPDSATGGPIESWDLQIELDGTDPERAEGSVSLGLRYSFSLGRSWAADVRLARL